MIVKQNILKECSYKTARSGGAGGQHVNKVETKVILVFDVMNSLCFSIEEKERLLKNLNKRINKANELVIQAQKYKSQHKNKQLAEEKLLFLLESALKQRKKRKKTAKPKRADEKRLKIKQLKSEVKKNRSKIKY